MKHLRTRMIFHASSALMCCWSLLSPLVSPTSFFGHRMASDSSDCPKANLDFFAGGHESCLHCFKRWAAQALGGGAPPCPLCRAPMPSDLRPCKRLQRTIEQAVGPDVMGRRREEARKEEAEEAGENSKKSLMCHPLRSEQYLVPLSQDR